MLKSMATEIGENVQVKANLAFMAKVIAVVGSVVWGYSVIWNKINELDNGLGRVQHEGTMLGDLSARMLHIEKFAEQLDEDFCKLNSVLGLKLAGPHLADRLVSTGCPVRQAL